MMSIVQHTVVTEKPLNLVLSRGPGFVNNSFLLRRTNVLWRKEVGCSIHSHQPYLASSSQRSAKIVVPSATTTFHATGGAEKRGRETVPDKRSAILLVDHGSRLQVANNMLNEIAEMVRFKANGTPVHIAHVELASPTVFDGYEACVANGATHVIVVPFFLAPGRHATKDIPSMTEEASLSFPGTTYQVSPPLGTHPGLADILLERAQFALESNCDN